MTFWKTLPGMILLIVLLASAAGCGVVFVQVWEVTHPPRVSDRDRSLALDLADVEEISFKASDGVPLAGWLFHGAAGRPAVVLCHDAGGSKAALVNLAITLQKRGLTVLAFDFRGHGASGAAVSTLGIAEKRDVLGAIDHLAAVTGPDHRRVGAYGVGMGAHAAVLAAADRPVLKAMVLDGMYPDAAYPLVRRVYQGWRFGVRNLGFAPVLALRVIGGVATADGRAAEVLPGLQGRDVLLVAPESNPALAAVLKTLYDTLPQRRDAESNLISLPAAENAPAAGGTLSRHYDRVAEFLESRLARH